MNTPKSPNTPNRRQLARRKRAFSSHLQRPKESRAGKTILPISNQSECRRDLQHVSLAERQRSHATMQSRNALAADKIGEKRPVSIATGRSKGGICPKRRRRRGWTIMSIRRRILRTSPPVARIPTPGILETPVTPRFSSDSTPLLKIEAMHCLLAKQWKGPERRHH